MRAHLLEGKYRAIPLYAAKRLAVAPVRPNVVDTSSVAVTFENLRLRISNRCSLSAAATRCAPSDRTSWPFGNRKTVTGGKLSKTALYRSTSSSSIPSRTEIAGSILISESLSFITVTLRIARLAGCLKIR